MIVLGEDLNEVIIIGWDNEGTAFMNGISALVWVTREFASSLLSAMSGYNEKIIIYKSGSRPQWTANVPELWSWTYQPSELSEITICCLGHLVYDYLLKQLEHVDTTHCHQGLAVSSTFPLMALSSKFSGFAQNCMFPLIWYEGQRKDSVSCTHP